MSIWGCLEFQGKTFGLRNLSSKSKKNKSERKKKKWLYKKGKRVAILSESQLVQRDLEWMFRQKLSPKTKTFLSSLKGSYNQFGRFTPKQFEAFKKIFFELKAKSKKNKHYSPPFTVGSARLESSSSEPEQKL